MTTLATVLNGAAVVTTATAPMLGNINTYNAVSGALAVTLPALSGLNVGATATLKKDTLDTTLNTVTFTANSGDTFRDTTTSTALSRPGQYVTLQVISISGTKYWDIPSIGEQNQRGGIAAITSEFSLANSGAATDVITTTLPAGSLAAGATYRIRLLGTVKVKATSGTLTLTPFIQGTALNTIQMATQTSAEGPVGFALEIMITVRSTGSSGTALAHGFGWIKFVTNTALMLTSTNTATTTVNTTAAAGSNVLKVQATWATADVANILACEIATIERVV